MKVRIEYVGPKGFTGSKIRASAVIDGKRKQLSIPYDHGLHQQARYESACRNFLQKQGFREFEIKEINGKNDNDILFEVYTIS